MSHVPVMLSEVLKALSPTDGSTYVDATFGAGGYSRAILNAADCNVIAFDRDLDAARIAKNMQAEYKGRFKFIHSNFSNIKNCISEKVDGIVADLGVSSWQIDTPNRGFSFQADGELDMRMDKSENIQTARDIINEYSEKDLADVIYQYGQERYSRKIASAIVQDRPFNTTLELANLISRVAPRSPKEKIHPATRTFQAIRIKVNNELGELEDLLNSCPSVIKPSGILCVVAFHSLEDGIVKAFLKNASGLIEGNSRYEPQVEATPPAIFKLKSRKVVKPQMKEIQENPRARSARMRVATRTKAPEQ